MRTRHRTQISPAGRGPHTLRLRAATAATVAAILLPAALAAQQRADSLRLVQLEARWNDAHRQGDARALDSLWAEDLVVIVPGMAAMGKAEVLAFARSGQMRFDRYATSHVLVRVHGDMAVVTGRLVRTRTLRGQPATDDWTFLKTYRREDGAWRVVAFAASPAPD